MNSVSPQLVRVMMEHLELDVVMQNSVHCLVCRIWHTRLQQFSLDATLIYVKLAMTILTSTLRVKYL